VEDELPRIGILCLWMLATDADVVDAVVEIVLEPYLQVGVVGVVHGTRPGR
jgi:hypothetical protein